MVLTGHLIFLILFLLLFAIMAIIGFIRLARDGRIVSSLLVLVCGIVFCVSTYLAATM
jgi:hypothetical membrane protein